MSDAAGLEEVRAEFLGKLKELAREMDPVGPFFLKGAEPSLIDFVIAPWIVSFFPWVRWSWVLVGCGLADCEW